VDYRLPHPLQLLTLGGTLTSDNAIIQDLLTKGKLIVD
jgi:hypothetical protein